MRILSINRFLFSCLYALTSLGSFSALGANVYLDQFNANTLTYPAGLVTIDGVVYSTFGGGSSSARTENTAALSENWNVRSFSGQAFQTARLVNGAVTGIAGVPSGVGPASIGVSSGNLNFLSNIGVHSGIFGGGNLNSVYSGVDTALVSSIAPTALVFEFSSAPTAPFTIASSFEFGTFSPVGSGVGPYRVVQLLTPSALAALVASGRFNYEIIWQGPAGGRYSDTTRSPNANFNFSLDSIYFTNEIPSAIPEPGEWAMLLVGLFALGLITRRRRLQKIDANPRSFLSGLD